MVENKNYFYQRITSRKEWQELRMRLFEERGGICGACYQPIGKTEPFTLHHQDYYRGDDPDYLDILHPSCHGYIIWYGEVEGRNKALKRALEEKRRRLEEKELEVVYWEDIENEQEEDEEWTISDDINWNYLK